MEISKHQSYHVRQASRTAGGRRALNDASMGGHEQPTPHAAQSFGFHTIMWRFKQCQPEEIN